jgi:hypothetical protein
LFFNNLQWIESNEQVSLFDFNRSFADPFNQLIVGLEVLEYLTVDPRSLCPEIQNDLLELLI